MPRLRLTTAAVDRIKPPKQGRAEYRDDVLPGLSFRVSSQGSKAWSLHYRVAGEGGQTPNGRLLKGRLRRMTLGTHPIMDLKRAREAARGALTLAEEGRDPVEARAADIAERHQARANTISKLANDFIRLYAKPNTRNWRKVQRTLELHVLPRWGHRPVESITRRDVIGLLDEIVAEGKPQAASEVLKRVRRMYSWAINRDIVEFSPCDHVKAPVKSVARDRTLTSAEVVAIWRAAEALGPAYAAFFRLLILTGSRRTEIAAMRWSWLDFDGDEPLLEIPTAHFKSNRPHVIPLSGMAVGIIEALPRPHGGDYVLGLATNGRRPFSNFSQGKRKLDEHSGVSGWVVHDIRRTVASEMARLGVDQLVIDRVLGHAMPGVRGVYQRYSYLPEKRRALETWADHIAQSIG